MVSGAPTGLPTTLPSHQRRRAMDHLPVHPLALVTVIPTTSWTVRDGKQVGVALAEETVNLKGYGDVRHCSCSSTTYRWCRS